MNQYGPNYELTAALPLTVSYISDWPLSSEYLKCHVILDIAKKSIHPSVCGERYCSLAAAEIN